MRVAESERRSFNREAAAPGVNILGDLTVEAGLGTAARRLIEALMRTNIPLSYEQIDYPFERKAAEGFALQARLPRGSPYAINLLCYNMAELAALVTPDRYAELTEGKYTVARWFWELPRIPARLRDQVTRVEEIWVASRFSQQSMRTVTSVPVEVIPVPIEVHISGDVQRADFDIPEDRYVFLFTFSAASSETRKNPEGLISAFERAFGSRPKCGPLLVIKGHHLDLFPKVELRLRKKISRVGGILLTDSYPQQKVNDLLACADCYVSLHRSEGFGLGMAESMYLGKPVIATYYSGNVDYMTTNNSYPVSCDLRRITDEDHPDHPDMAMVYEPGQLWAEPDLEQAAWWMRYVYEHQSEARERGERASVDIRRMCSPSRVGALIEKRLLQIENMVR